MDFRHNDHWMVDLAPYDQDGGAPVGRLPRRGVHSRELLRSASRRRHTEETRGVADENGAVRAPGQPFTVGKLRQRLELASLELEEEVLRLALLLARAMVTQFGMSDLIGPMAIGDAEQEVFLGRELTQRREVSERTSESVDDEIKRILDEAFSRARQTLQDNRVLLEKISEALLERETLDREDVDLLAAGMPLPEMKPRQIMPGERHISTFLCGAMTLGLPLSKSNQ